MGEACIHAELDHREGDIGLDADDHRHRPPQPGDLGDLAQGVRAERVEHVESGDVDDHPTGPVLADLVDQVLLEPQHLGVVQGGVDGGDQLGTLTEDRDECRPVRRHPAPSGRVTVKPSSRSASSSPPCRSPIVFILLRSTPIVTRVWAISGDSPVMITLAPISRDASTVCPRWLATASSTSGAPVMSMTTTLARWVRMPASSCSVSCRARSLSSTPMIGRMSKRPGTGSPGFDSSRMEACCCRMTRSRSSTKLTATVLA